MFNGLAALDLVGAAQPELAESWTVEQGGRVYRFTLREGVKWHDGQPFTSDDVKFSFEKALLVFHPRMSRTLLAAGVRIDTPNARTVIFSFDSPYAPLLQQLNVTDAPILPRHVYEKCTDISNVAGCVANRHPVGTGPFKFTSYDADGLRMVRNPDYFRTGQPYLDEVVVRVIPDPKARTEAVQAHTVDFLWDTPEADNLALREDDSLSVAEYPRGPGGGNCVPTLAFNLRPPPDQWTFFSDLRVRQAAWAATDLVSASPDGVIGAAQRNVQPMHWRIPVARTTRLNLPVHDVARAKLLLSHQGWKDEGGGVRVARGVAGVPDGTILSVEIEAAGARQVQYAQTLKEQWAGVGIDVDVRDVGGSDVGGSELPASIVRDRQFDAVIALYCNETDPVIGARRQYVSTEIAVAGGGNLAGYSNPDMDRLWDQATTELNPAKRQQIFQQIQELAVRDLPYMWLADSYKVLTWNRACSGLNLGNIGLFVETAICKR